MRNRALKSAWDVIEDDAVEAEDMKLRGSLMLALDRHIRTKGWTQAGRAPARRHPTAHLRPLARQDPPVFHRHARRGILISSKISGT